MRILLSALCVVCLSVTGLHAADDQDQEEKPQEPEEIPNFSQLDEYIYVPKSTMSLGTRFFLRGPKATYSGQGSIPSAVNPGYDATVDVPNISRTYIDGTVQPDSQASSVSNGIGPATTVPIPPDGRTNSWSYDNNSQLLPNGDMTFHTYSGVIVDTGDHPTPGVSTAGLELLMDRDMGNLGKHMKWSITVGFSIADIHSEAYAFVPTEVTTLTDTYDLFGQVPPSAPFKSPNNVTQTVINSSGQAQTGTASAAQTQTVTQTIYLGDQPLNRTYGTVLTSTENRYFIEGAYYTFRVGPTLLIPMGQHFKLSVSAGPDLIYSGDEFNVLETMSPVTGQPFTELYQQENTKLLPGYYVDVDLRYDVSETAGFYVGAMVQGAGSFSQSVASGTSASGSSSIGNLLEYQTRIDFGNEEGIKAGLTVRF